MRWIPAIVLLLTAGIAQGQESQAPTTAPTPAPPTARVDSPNEIDKLKESCGAFTFKAVPDCVEELFTGQPVHIAVGSIAPQNGFGAGLAYVQHKNTENWRINWDLDAVASNNASWRAGAYVNFVHSGQALIGHHLGSQNVKPNWTELPEHPVLGLYAQAISLNKLTYFGLGPLTTEAGRSLLWNARSYRRRQRGQARLRAVEDFTLRRSEWTICSIASEWRATESFY